MTTASKITLVRIALIPVFFATMLTGHPYISIAVFALASITDFVDGYVARHYNQVSNFGKFVDPLADKLLVTAAMLIFVEWGLMPSWALMVVLTREFAVTGLRLIAVESGRVIAAAMSGKIKTFATMVCIILMIFGLPDILNTVCVWIIVVTTLVSGVEYFVKNIDVLDLKK
ncbi:MAG: CDP-diacylglycerol--glycerol-3-phosphate 3-phosphatidyltransferase [Candidatus Heteroscillospira sp.]|jgi:CDP-diacylglycerol--glycerol-3-phosphate 3-phosphatidyltransferase